MEAIRRIGLRSIALVVVVFSAGSRPAPLVIDYPQDGSIFPPEITPPTFLWRDPAGAAASWRIDIAFADGSPAIHTTSAGERLRIGKIDPDCVADTNEPPKLTAQQAEAHTWIPSPAMWTAIKQHSIDGATVVIRGPVSRASIRIRASRDPAGAPIFYRDVPLMPSEVERGVIKPLAAAAIPLVAWRLRNLAEPASRVVLDKMPVCANCHSFSADGKTMGMDLDGLQSNRGLYILAPRGTADFGVQSGHRSMAHRQRRVAGKRARRLHVAGFSGRAICRNHD